MTTAYSPSLSHFGVACFDIGRVANFYCTVFGLQVTDSGPGITFPFPLTFLSARADQHHQLALSQNRPAGAPSTVMQVSFKVRTLDELREARTRALQAGATKMRGLNHGNALSIYFHDVEDNVVEVYLDTPWYVVQPHGDPLDLSLPDEQIWAETERRVRADPTFKPLAQWQDEFNARLAARG